MGMVLRVKNFTMLLSVFSNLITICFGVSSNIHDSNGEEITLPITYTTLWKGFGGAVNFRENQMNPTTIPACLFRSLSTAFLCNRHVQLTESDYVNYLIIGY